jgi:glycosyltransferase involved in cell wall biosynthesis
MKILFVASQLYFPQLYGGVQTSTNELFHALIARGHKASLLVKLMPGGWFGGIARLKMQINRRIAGCKIARDTGYGYPIWRTWFPEHAVAYVVAREKPDLIVIMSGGKIMPAALAAKQTGVPILVQLHDVAFGEDYGERIKDLGAVPFIANSKFTAERYHRMLGISAAVIHPFVKTGHYKTGTVKENVTFINPVRAKGVDIACEVARLCPDIPFSFIEGWTLSPQDRSELEKKLSSLPNVMLLPSSRDMSSIYRKCKILLVPSRFQETFGRVVTEAQACGIPAVASTRGGLPETVGPGGILLDPDGPMEDWAAAVRTLWNDDAAYARLSTAASAHAGRPEMNVEHQIEAHERALLAAAGKT